jgi:hypothetical protein
VDSFVFNEADIKTGFVEAVADVNAVIGIGVVQDVREEGGLARIERYHLQRDVADGVLIRPWVFGELGHEASNGGLPDVRGLLTGRKQRHQAGVVRLPVAPSLGTWRGNADTANCVEGERAQE